MLRHVLLTMSLALFALAVPPAPANLHAQVVGGAIKLGWTAAPGASTYNLYRGTASHNEALYATGIISLYFENTKVSKGPTYFYEVTAVNGTGESARSNEVSISLVPPASTTTAKKPAPVSSGGPGVVTFLGILVALLLAVGALVVVRWRTTSQPKVAVPVQSNLPLDDFADGGFFADQPVGDQVPAAVDLPAQMQSGGGLISRFSAPVPPFASAKSAPMPPPYDAPIPPPPPPMLDDTIEQDVIGSGLYGPTTEFTGGQYTSAQGTVFGAPYPDAATVGGNAPLWPTARASSMGPQQPNTTRSILLVAAGICAILGIFALGLFIFFNLTANSTANGAGPGPIVGSTSVSATATTQPTTVPPTPSPAPTQVTRAVVAIASGSSNAIGNFSGDMDVQGGSTDSTNNPIDTSGVQNPAPMQVYQNERYGEFTYTITGLTANAQFKVRLHFAEIYFTHRHDRQFNVAINGQPVLNDFDIVQAAGGPNKAVVRAFTATADGNGTITIDFTNGSVNYAKSSGIEIIPISG